MIDLISISNKAFKNGHSIALLPSPSIFSSRGCLLQEDIVFSDARSVIGLNDILARIDFNSINSINNCLDIEKLSTSNKVGFKINLRDFTSLLTGVSEYDFINSDLAVCKFESNKFYKNNSHYDDLNLLYFLSEKVFHALDIVRFIHCDLAIPDRLPHIPGCWCNSNGYIGCIVVSPNGNKIIAGRQSGGALTFGLGIGLEKEDIQSMERHPYLTSINPQFGEVGEVGKIIRHALKLYSKAMYLNNETMKFITSMALFEYLGAGGNYKPFKKIRAKLQAHLAENKEDYDSLTETFMMLTSKIVDDKNIGYRTKIIHEGALLEDILPVENDRRRLFGKLSGYIFDIITQMYNYTSLSFDELQEIRKQLLKDIGILT